MFLFVEVPMLDMKRRGFMLSGWTVITSTALAGCQESETGSDPEESNDEAKILTATPTSDEVSSKNTTENVIKGNIRDTNTRFGNFGESILEINFEYEGDIKPHLTVKENGETVYSESQTDMQPVAVEVSEELLAEGGVYEIKLEYNNKLLAQDSTEFDGFLLSVSNFTLDSTDIGDQHTIGEIAASIKNIGDIPAEIEDIQVTIGQQPVNTVFIVGSISLPTGKEHGIDGFANKMIIPGEYDVEIKAVLNDITIGRAITSVRI